MIKTLLFILFLLILPVSSIKAQSTGVQITPIGTDINVKTTQQISGRFEIVNKENIEIEVSFKEQEFINNQFIEPSKNWVSIKVNNRTKILPGKTLQVNYNLLIPEDTPKGVYNRLIISKFQTNEGNINLEIPYSLNIFVDSTFSSDLGIKINKFSVNNKIELDNNFEITLEIDNKGDNQVSKPIININIVNPSGKIIYTKVLNESLAPLYRATSYKITPNLPLSELTTVGQYKVDVLVTDTLSNKSILQSITFNYINYLFILIIVISIVFVLIFLRVIKKTKSKQVKKTSSVIGQKKRV